MYRRSRGGGPASPWTAALIVGVIAVGIGGAVTYNARRHNVVPPTAYNAPLTPYQNIAPDGTNTAYPVTPTTPGVTTTPGATTITPGTTTRRPTTTTPQTSRRLPDNTPDVNVSPPPSAPNLGAGGASGSARSTVPSYQTPTTAPTQPSAQPPTVAGQGTMEEQMIRLVNTERAKNGLPALRIDAQLMKVARVKSQDMINRNYFSHQSPTYGSPFDMLRSFGVTYRAAGENIALNQSTPAAHTALMNSTGHRANILGRQYTKVGIGIVKGSRGYYFTQLFTG
ncbi:MAG TPA: CAP domain-containing protein [Symbiobacteriaceae bacterium]|nr:CAP domain-containing protein [Symbiobacteriaceae bacterium]